MGMKVGLDLDSKRAIKLLTITLNDLIEAIISLHRTIDNNTAALEGAE